MGTIYGPFDLPEWHTMLMLKEDNRQMAALDQSKHQIAIKCNTNCLKQFFSKVTEVTVSKQSQAA